MAAYFLRRLLLMIPTFIGVTLIAFAITRMVPGGPLEQEMMRIRGMGGEGGGRGLGAGGDIPEESLRELKRALHLDIPWYQAYFLWLWDIAHLNLGESHRYREPVANLIIQKFPISIYFGLIGFVAAYLVCIPLGIMKALRHGSPFDFASSAVVFMGYSIPAWALGALLLSLLASGKFLAILPLGSFRSSDYGELPALVKQWDPEEKVCDEYGAFNWQKLSFRSKAADQLYHTVLPLICYMMGSFATLTVLMKNSLLENLGQDYVRTAFAKGLTPRRVYFWHALRNSLIPIATGLGHAIGILMAGSYLIELVFNIPGLGFLGYDSIVGRDYLVVMGVLAINTFLTLLGNIISDFLYAVFDPRIRFT